MRYACRLLFAALLAMPALAQAVDVDLFVRRDKFEDIKLSPDGSYYAATIALEDRTALAILRRSDNQVTAGFNMGRNTHVDGFHWVNGERVLVSVAQKYGALDAPQPTGELYAVDVDGEREILVGYRVAGEGPGTMIKKKKVEDVAAFLVDDLPADDKAVVISVMPFAYDPYTRAERMDVYSGRRTRLTSAPVRRATFSTDNDGIIRFANGAGIDNIRKLYYRAGNGDDWRLVNDEAVSGRREWVLGFAGDNRTAYLEVEQERGPNAIVSFDLETQTRTDVLRDAVADPATVIYRNGTNIPVGVFFRDGKPRSVFFDAKSPEARLQRSLEAAFPGQAVRITSQTADGREALVQVWSDRNPGDFYIFDTQAMKAEYLLSRRDWFDPEKLSPMQPIELAARDGLPLRGFITTPAGSAGKNLPLVVLPHGGPFDVQDVWGFDAETQLLASAGYAVLQLNFRGSGGFGRGFTLAGARQWGRAMQDDITDATRWAIAQGIADPGRICIYGGSYGAYAALMGAAREPSLYRCAVGYVGVYDLPMMHTSGDIQRRGSGETYLKEWLGTPEDVRDVSPVRLADRIKVPVLLAAGGEDERAPIEHSRRMEKALKTVGVPVETLYYDTEGHGFYTEAHRREYFARLLAFLSRHLGSAGSAAPAGTAP